MQNLDLQFLCDLVEKKSGIHLTSDKAYLLETRLNSLLKKEGIEKVSDLVYRLRWHPNDALGERVIDALTTNETFFFRDKAPFESLINTVLPRLITENAASKTLNFWSAACSSGQEPYSIAMLLNRHFPELSGWKINILATDLSSDILEKAAQARYTEFEIHRGLDESYKRYFDKVGRAWLLQREIRESVSFQQLNLIEPWPVLPRMDVVFLRNVLIYFKPEVKEQILESVHTTLRPSGYLFLGQSETIVQLKTPFDTLTVDGISCYRPKSHHYAES